MKLLALMLAAAVVWAGAEEPHIRAAAAAYEAGRAAQRNGDNKSAADLFRRAIEIEPTYLDAHKALIQAYLDSGHPIEAAESITRYLEMEPNAPRYRVTLGRILLDSRQPERALAQFSFVLGADPANREALLGFAEAASRAGMEDRAREALERGRKLYPADERFRGGNAGKENQTAPAH